MILLVFTLKSLKRSWRWGNQIFWFLVYKTDKFGGRNTASVLEIILGVGAWVVALQAAEQQGSSVV